MAAIDKVKANRGQSSPPPARPASPPPPPNTAPLIDAIAELSAPLRELLPLLSALHRELPELRGQMGAWPQAVSDQTAAALRTARQQDEAQQSSEAFTLMQERAAWGQETGQVLQLLQAQAGRQEKLLLRQERQEQRFLWGLNRDLWKGILFGVLGAVGLALLGGTFYRELGPPNTVAAALMEARDNLSDYRQLWDAATPAEQKKIKQRLADKSPAP